MNILFIGDIVGKPGRRAVRELLPSIAARHKTDFIVANCENAAGGFGVTRDVVVELFKCGIDVLTSGNHIWDKKDVFDFIGAYDKLLRPANYPEGTPGFGSVVATTAAGGTVGVLNLEGRVFMRPIDCPFRAARGEIAKLKKRRRSSSSISMPRRPRRNRPGVVSRRERERGRRNPHHIQTADERILPGGTAYLTDAGMTGSHDSVIGVKKEIIIDRFLMGLPARFDPAKGNIIFQGVAVSVDEETGHCSSIRRVSVPLEGEGVSGAREKGTGPVAPEENNDQGTDS
jgi:calcineurin-like phosphoesterase